ncbi:Tat proofreading chaperone DmsD [Necropsobacter massiliensis]|uniref:Tat proofreading chaperone DmsD n=1 Tax=Necropsobacter massiliensis TaxID=1400001 RepID=UPI000509B512|nr:Tat proofreading chaperone DmsD [Necropsobacter massiliensis]
MDIHPKIAISGRLLGSLFYYAPDDPRNEQVLDFFQQENWQDNWVFKTAQKTPALFEADLETLAQQYQALFIGPNALPAPPWGSVYLDKDGVIFGESLLKLREFLQQNQLHFVAPDHAPEDHIGLMLFLTAYLSEQHQALITPFLAQHFLPWAYRFLDLMIAQRISSFYRNLAQLTKESLQTWQRELALEPETLPLYR